MVYHLLNSGLFYKFNYRYALNQENFVLSSFLLTYRQFTGNKVLLANWYHINNRIKILFSICLFHLFVIIKIFFVRFVFSFHHEYNFNMLLFI